MIGTIIKGEKGNIDPDFYKLAEYQPTQDVRDFSLEISKDYQSGSAILNQSFEEFNDMSFVERSNTDQKAFNAYVDPQSDDPDEEWRSRTTRPFTRNKIVGMAAHIVASLIYPNVFAQNDQDEEDRLAGQVMRDLTMWNIKDSNYEQAFMFGTFAALVNPVAYLGQEFLHIIQTIKIRKENGEIERQEAIDEVLSGMRTFNTPADEILISNAYEYELQRQQYIIRRRFINFDEAQALYGDHENFKYIKPGVKYAFEAESGMFYEQFDDQNKGLVEEVIYYNRREDAEVPFVSAIYLGKNDVEENPINHRDHENRPKYNLVKTGFEPIDEGRFYFYKSAAFKLSNDQDLADKMWRMTLDGTFLSVMPPVATSGPKIKRIDKSVVFPGQVSNFPEGTTVTPVLPGMNLNAGWNAVREFESSMSESTQSPIRQGVEGKGSQTAFEIARLEQNARTQLGIFGRMLAKAVEELGGLMIDLIIRHQTVAEATEILGGQTQLKFRTFILPDQMEKGQKISKKIKFKEDMMDMEMDDDLMKKEGFRIMDEEGGMDANMKIFEVNPETFRKFKYKVTVSPDILFPETKEFRKAIRLEFYNTFFNNPLIDPEELTRFSIEEFVEGDVERFMRKKDDVMSMIQRGEAEGGTQIASGIAGRVKGEAMRGFLP